MFELTHVADAVGELDEIFLDADHLVRYGKPAQRILNNLLVRLVVLPKLRVLAPDAPHHVALVGFLDGGADSIAVTSQGRGQPFMNSGEDRVPLGLDAFSQRVERGDEGCEPVLLQFLSHFLDVYADRPELLEQRAAFAQTLFERERHFAVVANRGVGCGRNGVDRLGPDQIVHV